MNATQLTEFLYEWRTDRADGQLPDEWFAHRILKRTKEFVFVEYRVGANHLSRRTMKLRRAKLEGDGKIYWHDGTFVIGFYTEKGKAQLEKDREEYNRKPTPECLRVFELTREATVEDVEKAYRKMALKHHPDTGGSHAAFLRLTNHYHMAKLCARKS